MKNLPHIRSAIYGQPWLITETGMDQICAIVENAIAGGVIDEKFLAMEQKPARTVSDRYKVVDGVAVIPIMGPLFQRASLFTRFSGATSYDDISAMLNDALERMDVSAVCLAIDSPGGAVAGCFELATEIHEATKSTEKEIIASIEGRGCSAAYLLASQCQMVCATEASEVGSIGVIARFDDNTRAQKNEGNDVVVIRSKELKAPGNGPMTPNQMASIQKLMMKLDGMFEDFVKRGRADAKNGAFTAETFIGEECIARGLVDSIETRADVIEKYGALTA